MTEIINRQRRVIVQPVRPRVVTLDRGQVARIAQRRPHTVVQPNPTNAIVRPESPVVQVSNIGRPGKDGLPSTGAVPPIEFSYGDAAGVRWNAPTAGTFTVCRLDFLTPFNGAGATVKVGIVGNTSALMDVTASEPTTIGSYVETIEVTVSAGTGLWLEISPAGSSQGSGILYVTFVPSE